jgi:hypothetical protein
LIYYPPVNIQISANGVVNVVGSMGPPSSPPPASPPPSNPPPQQPPVGGVTKADFFFNTVKPMILAGGRQAFLAAWVLDAEGGMKSKLEPRLRPLFRSSQAYAYWLDQKSFGAPFNYETNAEELNWRNGVIIAGRSYPNA